MQANFKLKMTDQLTHDQRKRKDTISVRECVSKAWDALAPFWPLKNLIACNPLQGFENLPFEEAIAKASRFFQQAELPDKMAAINRETIKWCQAFFDESQATIPMPNRKLGLFQAWKKLARFDKRLNASSTQRQSILLRLPDSPEETIAQCLSILAIPAEEWIDFLTLLLTTLPGWASYIKYRIDWKKEMDLCDCPITPADYLAVRIVITTLLWDKASDLLTWYKLPVNTHSVNKTIQKIISAEREYQRPLLNELSEQTTKITEADNGVPQAQFIFCIDVRSEPFRRALESQGNYDTYGFAGFFGLPVKIENELLGKSYSSCPVLLQAEHTVKEILVCSDSMQRKIYRRKKHIHLLISLYRSLKYTFTTPFVLVDVMGLWSGLWMSLKTIAPTRADWLKQRVLGLLQQHSVTAPLLNSNDLKTGISLQDQYVYAEKILRMIGLTSNFAESVILCGHGSKTVNNAYATALDCGACGGHHGINNAKILACILNDIKVRDYLTKVGIHIPQKTVFFAAEHNTTTDEMFILADETINDDVHSRISKLKHDIDMARHINSQWRCELMDYKRRHLNKKSIKHVLKRSSDWAQTRPEWGLARNAAFIVAPRKLTIDINLEGRSFLHSYDWRQDKDGSILTTILTAPMIVAQWINSQYLFSTFDNIAYGSGSKITHNLTGKIGIMQGNSSDLMHGLPLQSVNRSNNTAYHSMLRLTTIIYAPCRLISEIISQQDILKKLLGNGWVSLICIDPVKSDYYALQRNLTWEKMGNH